MVEHRGSGADGDFEGWAVPGGGLPSAAVRQQVVSRLAGLEARGVLTPEHLRLAAAAAGKSVRTVQRWLKAAREEGRAAAKPRSRFTVTPEIHARLALWGGNAAAVHRELLAEARAAQQAIGQPGDATAEFIGDRGEGDCGEKKEVAGGPALGPGVTGGGGAATDSGGCSGVSPRAASAAPEAVPRQALPVPSVPSLATLQRAVVRDLNTGQRAALKGGERARRRHDVHLSRPRLWRNACWEADHKHLPVEVVLDGLPVRPWVTWFVDCATDAIAGAAVTPHTPSRDAILAALRIALSRDIPADPLPGGAPRNGYGPIGGLPELLRVDRGKDFLSGTVTTALGAFTVPVHDLPAYRPDLKGTVENLNRCVTGMFCAPLPGYLHTPTTALSPRRRRPRTAPPANLLSFADFTARLLDWVTWWNTEHPSQALDGRTPLQAWNADPTPIEDVPADLLWAFTLEDDGRTRTLTTKGVRWRGRDYVAPWMHGRDGTRVRVRFIPHHDHEIEVFDAATAAHLGPAHLADEATPAQRAALRRAKDAERRALARALAKADRRRERYAAVTTPTQPQRLGALTAAEADAELSRTRAADLAARALPDLIPPREPPPSWARPITRPATPEAPGPPDAAPRAIGEDVDNVPE